MLANVECRDFWAEHVGHFCSRHFAPPHRSIFQWIERGLPIWLGGIGGSPAESMG